MPDDTPDRRDEEVLVPDPDPVPPPRASRTAGPDRPRDDRYDEEDDDEDDRDAAYHPRGRYAKYDEDGYEITSEHTIWAVFAHIGVLIVGFIAPLVIWLVFTKKSPFVVRHAKESLNHQITLTGLIFLLYGVAVAVGFAVYGVTQEPIAGVIVGYVIALVSALFLGIANIVFMIMATIAASKAQHYRYPITIRLFG